MAIKIIFGPGGSGKSFFQMHIIIKQLRESRKNICTNLAINVPAFNAYLEITYPDFDLNLVGRLRILTDAETFEFWKYRGPNKWTGNEYDLIPDPGVFGVCYVIDEAGVSGFSATGWAQKSGQGTRGERCLWYLDQQRKFGDDVYASTNGRSPDQIAKPFRDKSHGFIKLKNGYLQQYGMFKGRSRFEWREFTEEPRKGSEDIAKGVFTLGKLADCYRTQDGVGVVGVAADKGKRASGISILWVVPAALVLALACVFVPYLLGKGASHYIVGTPQTIKNLSTPLPTASFEHTSLTTLSDRVDVYPVGYVVLNGRVNVYMSDDTTRTERDTELGLIQRNSITLKGQKYFIRSRHEHEKLPDISKSDSVLPSVVQASSTPTNPISAFPSAYSWDGISNSWKLNNPLQLSR